MTAFDACPNTLLGYTDRKKGRGHGLKTNIEQLENGANGFSYQHFIGLNLSQTTIALNEFDKCIFTRCNFMECIFAESRFLNCLFERRILSALQFPTSSFFSAVRFTGSNVIGVDWFQAKTPQLGAMEFIECDLPIQVLRCSSSN
ncbi:MAG TPA: hypothetical protein VH540_03650 [Ktedonobacterales bacterium]|jgi:uncharacterized protein YjbI with pentapeptide repeats